MNTSNGVGYLLGALVAPPVISRVGSRRAFVGSLAITTLAVALCGSTGGLGLLLVLRFVAGVAGAVAFIVGASLAAQLGTGLRGSRPALVLGVYFAGVGFGIVLSGLLIPGLLAQTGVGGWRWGWLALGIIALLATVASVPATRRTPLPREPSSEKSTWHRRPIRVTLGAYGLFGVGYTAYMTFIIAFLKNEGAGSLEVSGFWVVLGLAAIVSTCACGPVLDRLHGGRGIALATGVATVGALVPLVFSSAGGTFASATLVGLSFLTVPTAVIVFARRTYTSEQWTNAISALTVAFALGQCLGPALAGVLSDGPSGVSAGLTLGVATLFGAGLLALAQRDGQSAAAAHGDAVMSPGPSAELKPPTL